MKYRECPPRGGRDETRLKDYIHVVAANPNPILTEPPFKEAPPAGTYRYEPKTRLPELDWRGI